MRRIKSFLLIFLSAVCLLCMLPSCEETESAKRVDTLIHDSSNYHVHLELGNSIYHFDISSYYANATGILQLELPEKATKIYVQSGAVIYRTSKCPICGYLGGK